MIVATELAYHLKIFIDDIVLYYGSNLEALMLIIQGIESIVRQRPSVILNQATDTMT
jgi:hypothetical protein